MTQLSRPLQWRAGVALVVVGLALAACGTTVPSASPPKSGPPSPSAQATASESPGFDLTGTAWTATSIMAQAVPAERAPRLEFDWIGRSTGTGFTGCDEFGFVASFDDRRVAVGDLILDPDGCAGAGGQVEDLFLAAFRAAEAWSVDADRLTLAGPRGQVVLERELPPLGDPGRQLADALRRAEWRILRAPGVVGLNLLSPVRFADTLLIGAGHCGFSGDVRFDSGGALRITDVGWDTAGCAPPEDGRPTLPRLLQAVTRGAPAPEGTIALSGPRGDVVLGP